MKIFTTSTTFALLAGLFVNAAPAPASTQGEARQVLLVEAILSGAGPNPPSYTELIPGSGSVNISNPLSVSHITLEDSVTCTFFGEDGSVTTITNSGSGSTTVDVGPPQPQVSASCVLEG